jgi:hypothetical protein
LTTEVVVAEKLFSVSVSVCVSVSEIELGFVSGVKAVSVFRVVEILAVLVSVSVSVSVCLSVPFVSEIEMSADAVVLEESEELVETGRFTWSETLAGLEELATISKELAGFFSNRAIASDLFTTSGLAGRVGRAVGRLGLEIAFKPRMTDSLSGETSSAFCLETLVHGSLQENFLS